MKCHKHYEMDAVSTCLDCGKTLCPDCTEKYTIPSCDECAYFDFDVEQKSIKKSFILSSVLFVLSFALILFLNFLIQMDEFGFIQVITIGLLLSLWYGYNVGAIVWGWKALNKITPEIFLFMPIGHWILYFLIKLALSSFVGIFVTPFFIFKYVKRYKKLSELKSYALN